jgi:Tol biopolymer transport system component
MDEYLAARWGPTIVGVLICVVTLVVSAKATATESVRAELIRLQQETGLTLAWIHDGVNAVVFKKRALVILKDSLQSFRPDGFSFGEHPEVPAIDMCWSQDQTKLVSIMINHSTGSASLGILDLNSKQARAVAINVDQRPMVTSQCWSQNDKKLVYETDGTVRLYDIENDRADAIAKGTDPTWSSDGEWIAFRDRDTYYAIHPNATGRKKLFHNYWGGAVSALYWSPDSRIVAYVRELGFLQGGALDAEVNHLRARRLEDGSDVSLCPDSVDWYANYHWITTSELKKHSRSESAP